MSAGVNFGAPAWPRIAVGDGYEGPIEIAETVAQSAGTLSDGHHGPRKIIAENALDQRLWRAGVEGPEIDRFQIDQAAIILNLWPGTFPSAMATS
jgi:hypothetical protein